MGLLLRTPRSIVRIENRVWRDSGVVRADLSDDLIRESSSTIVKRPSTGWFFKASVADDSSKDLLMVLWNPRVKRWWDHMESCTMSRSCCWVLLCLSFTFFSHIHLKLLAHWPFIPLYRLSPWHHAYFFCLLRRAQEQHSSWRCFFFGVKRRHFWKYFSFLLIIVFAGA